MEKTVEKLMGMQIAKIRKHRDLTQEQLAELVDVATETISRLERGVSTPSLKTLEKLSRALHTNLKDFFDTTHPQKPTSEVKKESMKLLDYLNTKNTYDIKMSYRILKNIFDQIEKIYQLKK